MKSQIYYFSRVCLKDHEYRSCRHSKFCCFLLARFEPITSVWLCHASVPYLGGFSTLSGERRGGGSS